jgi:uncharacterized membrane protein
MLVWLENAVIITVVAVVNAAIFLISPSVGLFALVVTVPVTLAILHFRPR